MTKYNLRPRRKNLATTSKTEKPNQVKEVFFTIEYNGKIQQHAVVFDKEPLTLKEMYNNGFIGEVILTSPEGVNFYADVIAGPVGEFEGTKIGRFVFKVCEYKTKTPIPALVKKFNFSKT